MSKSALIPNFFDSKPSKLRSPLSIFSILTLYFSISTLQNANLWEHEINASIKKKTNEKTKRKENNKDNYVRHCHGNYGNGNDDGSGREMALKMDGYEKYLCLAHDEFDLK